MSENCSANGSIDGFPYEATASRSEPIEADSYESWCAKFVERHVRVAGLCRYASEQVALAFPELRVVRGFCMGNQHWWTVAPDGQIVDPTASQFGSPTPSDYTPFDESRARELPTGKCMICGDHLYYNASACSADCARELVAEYSDLEGEELDKAVSKVRLNPDPEDPETPCIFVW